MNNETKSPLGRNKPKNNYAGDITRVSSYDVCQTPPHAVEPILPLLSPDWLVWESAVGPERLLYMSLFENGVDVIGTDLMHGEQFNFFTYQPSQWTVQVTNPPWSIKYEWIEHSFKLGRPFALLVPYETTFAAKFRNVARLYHNKPWPIEVLTPERRINYKMPNTGWGVEEYDPIKDKMVKRGDSAQMPTMWLTWGLNAADHYPEYIRTYEVPMRSVRYNPDNTPKL